MTTIQPTGRRGRATAHRLTAEASVLLGELGFAAAGNALALRLLLLDEPTVTPWADAVRLDAQRRAQVQRTAHSMIHREV